MKSVFVRKSALDLTHTRVVPDNLARDPFSYGIFPSLGCWYLSVMYFVCAGSFLVAHPLGNVFHPLSLIRRETFGNQQSSMPVDLVERGRIP